VAAVAVWKKKMDTKKAMNMASSSFTMPSTARTIDLTAQQHNSRYTLEHNTQPLHI
jgi:hypothetical protein